MKILLWVCIFSLLGNPCCSPETVIKNKRIVCLGDSLTVCGGEGGRYTDWLAKSLPDCEIINKGISGDTLKGGRGRFQADVLDIKPNILIIELGANDFWAKNREIIALNDDLEFMIKEAQKRKVRVVIAGVFGNMIDGRGKPIPKTTGIDSFGVQILHMERELASKYKCSHIENIQADLTDKKYWADTNHPNSAGNSLVAKRILAGIPK